jgi:polyisoprenoid-binding protein YceI
MKSHIIHMFELAKRITFAILVAAILPISSPLSFADGGAWIFDSASSSARLYQGSAANPDSVNLGVARVTGSVKIDINDLDNSVFDLNIYAADEQWGHALSPEATLPAGYVPDATDHTLLTFHSKRILRTKTGELQVIGDLTLTRVERSVTLTPSEAYAGPVYGDPVVHTETRQVSFLFPGLSAALSSDLLKPVSLKERSELDLSGAASIGHENFPELLTAIQATNWPAVVKDEQCQTQSTIGGEGYEGPSCTGNVVAVIHQDNCQITTSVGGEGYSGPVCTPPAGNETKITLNLKFLHTGAEPPTTTLSGNGATR